MLEFALAGAGKLVALGLDAHGFHLWLKAQAAGDAIMEKSGIFILELNDTITVETNEVIVLGLIQKIWIVKGLVTTEIDFAEEVTVYKKLERAINGRTRNGTVELAGLIQKFVGIEMIVSGKGSLDNNVPLLGAA